MTRDELLTSLLVERYGENRWWTRKSPPTPDTDDDLTTARRRRELDADFRQHERNAS